MIGNVVYMKRAKYILLLVLSLISFTMVTNAADLGPKATSSTDYATCYSFADKYRKTITLNEGYYYYKYCYRATCSNKSYHLANMVQLYGYSCQNGNTHPYLVVTSDGCHAYTGGCSTNFTTYCTRVFYIDCRRTTNGSQFNYTTKSTTTKTTLRPTTRTTTKKPTTTSSKRTTTGKTTTKKPTTTTKKPTSSTKKTTKTTTTTRGGIIITPTTTSSSTSTTSITLPTSEKKKSTDIKAVYVNDRKISNLSNSKDETSIKIPEGTNEVDIRVELEYAESTYTVTGNTNIPDDIPDEGVDIIVDIKGYDGNTRKITINVNRQTNESDDCKLASIYVEKYFVDFSKNTTDYTIELPKEVKTLNPDIVTSDENATFKIEGDENLKNNSKIRIEVIAQNGDKCYYNITIKKPSNTWKYILVIIMLVVILVVAGILLMKYLKKSKGTYKYE